MKTIVELNVSDESQPISSALCLSVDQKTWFNYGKLTASERRELVAENQIVFFAGKLSERRKVILEKLLVVGAKLEEYVVDSDKEK